MLLVSVFWPTFLGFKMLFWFLLDRFNENDIHTARQYQYNFTNQPISLVAKIHPPVPLNICVKEKLIAVISIMS